MGESVAALAQAHLWLVSATLNFGQSEKGKETGEKERKENNFKKIAKIVVYVGHPCYAGQPTSTLTIFRT